MKQSTIFDPLSSILDPRPSIVAALCALMAIIECAAQTPGRTQTAVKNDREAQRVEARVKTDQDIFDFHSGFWMNLHHFLYQQALAQKGSRDGRAVRGAGEVVSIEALDDEQKRVWTTVLESYQKNWVDRDLLFDDDLVKINYRLAELENQTALKQSGLPDELIVALEQAGPVYRAHWWKEHDRINRSWIAEVASFYTTGEIVKRALSKDGQKDYTPYAYKQGLYERAPNNQRDRLLLERHWQPYLDGKSDFAQAIKQMVMGL